MSLHRMDVRLASATAQRRRLLAAGVAEIFTDSHETYGYRRVHAALRRRGEHCSAELVRALTREQGLVPARVGAFRPRTTLAPQDDITSPPNATRCAPLPTQPTAASSGQPGSGVDGRA